MFVNEEVVEGQEGEVSEEVKETPGVVEKEAAQPEVEVKDPNLVDDEGVSWKNRAKEFERKYYRTLEAKAQETPKESEEIPELTPEEQAISEVIRKTEHLNSKAVEVVENVLSNLNTQFPGHFDNEDGELRRIILETSKGLDDKSKLNPTTIQNIAFMAAKIRDVNNNKEKKPAVKKLVSQRASGSEVLSPSAKGGAGSEIQLTEEEEEYASDHRLDSKGFNSEEIRDMYKLSRKKT